MYNICTIANISLGISIIIENRELSTAILHCAFNILLFGNKIFSDFSFRYDIVHSEVIKGISSVM